MLCDAFETVARFKSNTDRIFAIAEVDPLLDECFGIS
jgi:hypothetical protein